MTTPTTNTTGELLRAVAAVEVEATAQSDKPARVKIVAYTGGTMNVPGWPAPVVIDLNGLDASGEVTLLGDHKNELASVIGTGVPIVANGTLAITGTLTKATDAARQVIDLARDGVKLQASVGVEPGVRQFIRPGDSIKVNGRTIKAGDAGLTLVRSGVLREVSITPNGADRSTSVAISAKAKGTIMEPTTNITTDPTIDATQAERNRVIAVREVCAGRHDKIEAQAIGEGWTADQARQAAMAEIRASRPIAPAIPTANYGPAGDVMKLLAAGLLMHWGRESVAENAYGERLAQQARDLRCHSGLSFCETSFRLEHRDIPHGRNEMIRAALSTTSLPNALGDAANKILLSAYTDSPASWRQFCMVKSANNFKSHTAIRPSAMSNLAPLNKGGGIVHGTLTEGAYTYSVDSYARILTLDRRDIINDDLGLFVENSLAFGRAAARSVNDLVWETVLANANSFFHADHNNYAAGAGTVLQSSSLQAGRTAMLTQRDDDGNDLDIPPVSVAVPPELSDITRTLLESDSIQQIATEGGPTGNSLKNSLSLIVEPRLSNTTKYSAASTKHWYIFAGPQDAPMIVAFLNDQQAPTVEFFGFDSDPNVLAATWRVYMDYGAALGDYRAAYRAKGEA